LLEVADSSLGLAQLLQLSPRQRRGFLDRLVPRQQGSKQKGYSGHGLRKASATIAAESGANESELNAMFGWSGRQMAQLYTRKADRKRLAARAIAKWARPSSEDVVGEFKLTHLMLEKERA
jgi:integrase